MKLHCLRFSVLWSLSALAVPAASWAQSPPPGKNLVPLRGNLIEVKFYPSRAPDGQNENKVLYAPGDWGMHGFAVTIAETMASWGYDVYAIDTKHYLESFTGKTTLQPSDVMRDFNAVRQWMVGSSDEKVALVGWSEGAGLALLAASSNEFKSGFSGLIVFGLTETNVLAWRLSDYLTYLTHKEPAEPSFASRTFLPQVSPLPLVLIQSTHDQYTSMETARSMFRLAGEPKRFELVEAQNHRFEGNQPEFFRRLRNGLAWLRRAY